MKNFVAENEFHAARLSFWPSSLQRSKWRGTRIKKQVRKFFRSRRAMSASRISSPSCVLPATRIRRVVRHADLPQQPAHVERAAFGEFGGVKFEVAHHLHRFAAGSRRRAAAARPPRSGSRRRQTTRTAGGTGSRIFCSAETSGWTAARWRGTRGIFRSRRPPEKIRPDFRLDQDDGLRD